MVARYEATIEYDGEDSWAFMEEHARGDYVDFSEYQELQDRYDDLKERIYELYRSV